MISITRASTSGGVSGPLRNRKITRKAEFVRTPGLANPLRAALLDQKVMEHQKLVLTYTGALRLTEAASKKATSARKAAPIKAGDPVKFTWTVGRYKCVFVGYVYSVKQNATPKRTITTVVCLGASKILRNHRSRVFRNVTASDVVRKIAKQAGLKAVVHDTSAKKKMISQSGMTDWQLLRQLANQSGRALWVNGTTLYFVNVETWAKSKVAAARVFNYRTKVPIGLILGQNLYAFRPNLPDDVAGTGEDPIDVKIAVEDQVPEYLDLLDETSVAVEVPVDYLETFGIEPDTTADGLIDETPAIIEPGVV